MLLFVCVLRVFYVLMAPHRSTSYGRVYSCRESSAENPRLVLYSYDELGQVQDQ